MYWFHRFRIATAILIALTSAVVAEIKPAGDAPPPHLPEQSAAMMQISHGFRIELVAAEPLVADPVGIAIDEQGRLFVSELHGYNIESKIDVDQINKGGVLDKTVQRIRWEYRGGEIAEKAKKLQFGIVKMLTDTDGDGRMDKADVWAEHIPPAYGLVPARGGVIVICAPDILYLADRDGDGKAEVRQTLYSGFKVTVLERAPNNPRWGLDNWIYVGTGGFGGTITGPNLPEPVEIGRSDFRIKADGSAIEPVTGAVNTFGLSMTDWGERFTSAGSVPVMYALPLGHRYLKRNPFVPAPDVRQNASDYDKAYGISPPHPWRIKRGQDPAWIKFYGKRETDSGYFTGGSGALIYRAELFPRRYHGQYFSCEPSQNIIHHTLLERDGSAFRARRPDDLQNSEFLASSDLWFRPVNLKIGPEGGLYIVDMYREIIEDYSAIPRFLQQQYNVVNGSDRGRIWRLLPEKAKAPALADMSGYATGQLVEAIAHPNAWWRLTAQRLLVERQDRTAAPALKAMVRSAHTPQARVHALYTLDGIGLLDASDVAEVLDDPTFGVRMNGLMLAERWLDSNARLLAKVLTMTDDNHAKVRLQLAMSLGESSDAAAATALLKLAIHHGQEQWMPSAILSSARNIAGTLLVQLLKAGKLTPGARALLEPLAATVGARRESRQIARALELALLHDQEIHIQTLKGILAGISRGSDPLETASVNWTSIHEFLASDSHQVRVYGMRLASQVNIDRSPAMQKRFDRLGEKAHDNDESVEVRKEAITELAFAPYETLAPTAKQLMDPRQPPALQEAAIKALASSDRLEVGPALLARWEGFTPALRKTALNALFARENRLPALLDAIEAGAIRPSEIEARRREQLNQSSNEQIASRAKTLLENSATDTELQHRIDRYAKALASTRNTSAGREVFVKQCLICHKINDEGHEVGPPLGSVVNKPDEAIMIDVLDPSSHIESEYRSYIVATEDGGLFTGVLVSDSATSVTLRRGEGLTDVILRTDIESITASELSLMPSNLHEQIDPQQLADLIGYLREAMGSAPTPSAYAPLFNGRDLSGWVNINCGPNTWSVRDGVIHCTGKPTGELRTTRMYENFVLELEWRHLEPKGNAGVFVWADALPARGVPFHRAVEVQVLENDYGEGPSHSTHGDIFPIHGATMIPINGRGGVRSFPIENRSKPSPQWNHYRISCNNGDIFLEVNGKLVTRGRSASPRKGYICLESEGAPVQFRNLMIKELPTNNPAPVQIAQADRGFKSLYNGIDLTGWKMNAGHEGHWQARDWTLTYDGKSQAEDKHLWSKASYGDFILIADWRFPAEPVTKLLPVTLPTGDEAANPDGTRKTEPRVFAGNSGIFLRGSRKAEVNMTCKSTGSGEIYGFRVDRSLPQDLRAGMVPTANADRKPGQWNRFVITMIGDRLTVVLNDQRVIDQKQLPGIAPNGPLGLQHHGDPLEFANIFIKELD